MAFNGLSNINIELTSRCNKSCRMCGRRKIEREYPELAKWGDMDYEMVKSISEQIPEGIVVQFHDNGEPLLYPRLGEALALFNRQIRCLDTNGKLLLEKVDEVIGNLETITISVFENDPEQFEQCETLVEFWKYKGGRKPRIVTRLLGDVNTGPYAYYTLGLVAKRVLHSPMGSYEYKKGTIIPEIGICLEALHHLSIKRNGDVAMCVRFDPERRGIIGNLQHQTLEEIWDSPDRGWRVYCHIWGERDKIPVCNKCEYWGCPNG